MSRHAWRVVPLIVGAILFGATLFGLWHLVVGGLINGNARAGTFGLVLALVAGTALVADTWLVRRHRRDPLSA